MDKKMKACCRLIVVMMTIGLFALNISIANAENKKAEFPIGCNNVGHGFDLYNVIFTPAAQRSPQTVYFIHNISNEQVYLLEAPEEEKSYVIYNNGNVKPDLWSILAVTKKGIKFTCTTYDKQKKTHQVVNCQKHVAICEFTKAHFGSNHRGTYWLAVNKSRKSAVAMARNYGIWLNAIHHNED